MKERYWYNLICSQLQLGTVAVCLLFSFSASAQTDTTKKLNEVSISATRSPFINTVTPAQQVSADDFVRYGAFNVADAIRGFSGVSIKDYGGIGGLKTVSVRGLGANHVAVIFDGIQINDAENGQVDLGKLNLNNIQQIALYNGQVPDILQPARSFASASILSIKTKKPNLGPDKPYAITAGIKTGSFGLVSPYFQWQQRLGNNWSAILNGYGQNATGRYNYLVNDGSQDSQQTRNGAAIGAQQLDGALYWAKGGISKFNVRVNYYNSDRGLPGPVILFKEPPYGQRLWNKEIFAQAGYQQLWQHGWGLLINSKFAKNNLHYFDPQFPSPAGYLDQDFSQREFYQSVSVSYSILPNWQVSYAADVVVNNMSGKRARFSYPTRVTVLNAVATNFTAGKAQFQASLLNTNLEESVSTGKTIPNLNVYSPTLMASIKPWNMADIRIRAFYKYIFRPPTFNELYYGFVVNTNLKPEFTNQYNLGITYNKNLNCLLQYITFTADAYYNNVNNKIVYTPNLYNGSVQNYGKVKITGLDAGFTTAAKLGEDYHAVFSANYSYQKAINITNPTESVYLNQLPYIPLNSATFNIGVTRRNWSLYYNQFISASRYYTNNNLPGDALPNYAIGDLSAVYKHTVCKLPFTLSAELSNILNKNYSVVQSYPMPGRSFRISFQITI